MRRYIAKQLDKNDKLLKHSLVILIGSAAVNLLNYLYQLLMGRMLGPADYSVLGALFAIVYIVTFSFGAIKMVVMRFASAYFAKREYGKIKWLFFASFKKLMIFGLIGLVLFSLVAPFIARFLNINVSFVVLLGTFLFLSLLASAPIGFLNGLQRFFSLNIVSILGAVAKLLFGVLAVFLGTGVFGVMVALNIAQLFALLIVFLSLIFLFRHKSEKGEDARLSYIIPVFVGLPIMNLFVNVDILLVKHYFPLVSAGYYTAASVIGKIILFGSSALLVVMFPKVSFSHDTNGESNRILKSTLFYTLVISGLALALYYTIPTFISRLLFGKAYDISQYVGIFGLVLGIFSVSNVLVNYNLAVKRTSFVYFLIPLLLIEIIGIVVFHNTLLEVIQVVLVVNVILLGYMLFVTRKALGVNII